MSPSLFDGLNKNCSLSFLEFGQLDFLAYGDVVGVGETVVDDDVAGKLPVAIFL